VGVTAIVKSLEELLNSRGDRAYGDVEVGGGGLAPKGEPDGAVGLV
jgi:hypothetical protein